jgi:hypothetical protein
MWTAVSMEFTQASVTQVWGFSWLEGRFMHLGDRTREELGWKELIHALITLNSRSSLSHTIEQWYNFLRHSGQ